MTQMDLFQAATSSQQDTPASPFHLPATEEAVKMTDISGHTYFPLFKPNDPLGAFSRMFMGMSLWASTRCYLTWKGKATPQGRSLFQLVPLTHPIDETEFGSSPEMWATPAAADSQGTTGGGQGKSLRTDVNMWPTPLAQESKHGEVTNWEMETDHAATKGSLRVAVAKSMWPTPRVSGQENLDTLIKRKGLQKALQHNLTAAVQMWPTPKARDWKDGTSEGTKGRHSPDLGKVVGQSKTSGSLNPQWVEWLMGYPEGWTDLED
jgi:hypothetical protein